MNIDYNILISTIGALSWVPHLWGIIKKKVLKPKLSVYFDKSIYIGFNNEGPNIALNIAILCENKSSLINDISVILTHENNQKTEFHWNSIQEELMDLTIPGTGSMSNTRNHQAIALRIDEDSLLERRFWFTSPKYSEQYSNFLMKVREVYLNHTNSSNEINIQTIKASTEYNNLLEFFRGEFIWKSGKYSAEMTIKTSDGTLTKSSLGLFLTRIDHKTLETNIPLFKQYLEQEFFDRNIEVKEWDWAIVQRT